jgi:hypothetical protein
MLAVAVTACGHATSSSPPVPTFTAGAPPRQSPPDPVVGGFSIQLPSITLAPGDEQFPCFIFPMELQGPSHLVGGAQIVAQAGMHHGNVTSRPSTGSGVRACPDSGSQSVLGGEGQDVANGGTVLFGSSTQHVGTEWQSMPEGMAYPVKDGSEIVARMHYLNASTQPLTVAPTYTWYTVDEASVTTVLAPFIWVYSGFQIPPGATYTVEGDCNFTGPMKIVSVLPHMHQLGTRFTAGFLGGPLDGQLWLDSKGYDPGNGVIQVYDPPIDLSQGDGATFACTWLNTTTDTIVEGVGKNEMCMLFGYGFPGSATYSAVVAEPLRKCVYVATPGQ